MSQYPQNQGNNQQRAMYSGVVINEVRSALTDKMRELKGMIRALEEVKRLRGIMGIFFQGRVGSMTEREALDEFRRMLTELVTIVQNAVHGLDLERSTLQAQIWQLQAQLESMGLTLTETKKGWGEDQKRLQYANSELQQANSDKQSLQVQMQKLEVQWREELRKKSLLIDQSEFQIKRLQDQLYAAQTEAQNFRKKGDGFKEQVEVAQRQLSAESQNLTSMVLAAHTEIERLEDQERQLKTGGLNKEIVFSYYEYDGRLRAAAQEVRVKGVLPGWKTKVNRDGIDTLFYSYNPSLVADALDKLNSFMQKVSAKKENLGRERVLNTDMLFNFAGVLGYFNLNRYLLYLQHEQQSHKDGRFLSMLCDLSVPSSQIQALVSDLDAASWLAAPKHMPSKGEVPNSPCSFTFKPTLKAGKSSIWNTFEKDVEHGLANLYENYDDAMRVAIAGTIIELEKQSLLDFRESLYVAVSAIAPLSLEEVEQQEQRLQEQFFPTEPTSALKSMPVIRVVGEVHQPELDEGVHIIEYEYRDLRYLSTPVKHKLAFDNNGNVLAEENDPDE